MSDTETKPADDGRVTRRMLAAGEIERVMSPEKTSLVPISDFGLKFENAFQMGEAAKLMATAGPMLPEWLQGNVGGCWGIILRATELGISPLTLANWSYLVENKGVKRVAYESQFYHSIVEARAPIKESLQHEIIGEGEERRCKVWATFRGESKPKEFTSETLGHLRPGKNEHGKTKGSPLWDRKPELQLFYDASRDWARMHCPHILGGVYAREELDENEDVRAEVARDVSPGLRDRLRGPVGATDMTADIDAAIKSARVDGGKKSGRVASAGEAGSDASAEAASSPGQPPATSDDAVAASDQSKEQTQ